MEKNSTVRATALPQPVAERVRSVTRPDPTATVFDIKTGMPLTRAAARSMSAVSIQAALDKAVEALPGRRQPSPSNAAAKPVVGAPLDSLEVVWLLAKFEKLFEKPLVDLTKVSAPRWSSIDAVAELIHESIGAQR
ncbi:hypothetical protein AB0301_05165 [Microbacterium profundi]|uniref:Carrier domain-containing protein n=1 Tax=Microbacterium profundi TaxID=450380 RepID=A0ABV3LEX6_9MICO